MGIYHYMLDRPNMPVARVITNHIEEVTASAVERSTTNSTVEYLRGRDGRISIVANDSGSWEFALLMERAEKMGVHFYIVSYDINDVAQMDRKQIEGMFGNANFGWATSSNMILIKFFNHEGFNLEPLGLSVQNHKKLLKRLTEVIRNTGHYYYGDITHRAFETPDGHEDIYYDGGNAISAEFAAKLGFDGVRCNIRVLLPIGLVKGDAIVVPDLDVDLVFHTENLKPELSTDGWSMATLIDHPPIHEARYDRQTKQNFRFFLTDEMELRDLNKMLEDIRKSVEEGGELHEYLNNQSQAFDDPIAIDLDRIQMSDRLEDQAKLLKEVGIPPAIFSNIPFTRLIALHRKMNATKVGNTIHHRRPFIPMSNAFVASVSTYEFCTELCGMEFPGEDGTRTFYHRNVGLVIPGERFFKTYDLHGGHDGDDTWLMLLIKVYCSSDERYEELMAAGVIDRHIEMGDRPEDAVYAALAIRRPNGPGEYSIEAIAPDMPWSFYNKDWVMTYDLANAPKAQGEVFANADISEILTVDHYDREFDREFAYHMALAQTTNPRVGPYANFILTCASIFGPDNIPGELITLQMEETIDIVQQTADAMAFTQIANAVTDGWVKLRDIVLDRKIKVDAGIVATRVPKTLRIGEEIVPIGQAIVDAKLYYAGPAYRLHHRYTEVVAEIKQVAMTTANAARFSLPLAQKIVSGRFRPEVLMWAENWLNQTDKGLRELDNTYRAEASPDDHALIKRQRQNRRRIELEQFMDKRVSTIRPSELGDVHLLVMALHKVILTPTQKYPIGRVDRVFVQPSSKGRPSMLQLFIEACAKYNLLPDTTYIKASRLS